VPRFVINLRGAGGAGKTTLVRRVLDHKVEDLDPWPFEKRDGGSKGPSRPALWPVARCIVPGVARPIYVQGSYAQAQGGCDTCKDMDAIERMIRKAAEDLQDGHVLFEGKFVSDSAERWATFKTRVERDGLGTFLWMFLRLPKEELIRRTMVRNGGKELKSAAYYDGYIKSQNHSRNCAKAISEKRHVVDLDATAEPVDVYNEFLSSIAALEVDP